MNSKPWNIHAELETKATLESSHSFASEHLSSSSSSNIANYVYGTKKGNTWDRQSPFICFDFEDSESTSLQFYFQIGRGVTMVAALLSFEPLKRVIFIFIY